MRPLHKVALCIFLMLAARISGNAESRPLEMKWDELAGMIGGHRVDLVLAGAKTVRGTAVSVRQDSLLMDVASSTDAGYPKGSASVPRTAIELIKLRKTRGSWGRGIGTTLGVLTGMTVGGYVAGAHANSPAAGIPVFLVITGATTIAGYYAGRSLDSKVTLIRIVP